MAAFARQAVAGRESAEAKARALYDELIGIMRDGRLAPDRDNTPKAREPLTATELWARVERGDSPAAGCYELTVLYLGMARSLGLSARGVEPLATTDTGAIGHVLAQVDFGNGESVQVDLQNHNFGKGSEVRPLSDAELVAHHVNHRAVAAMLRGDTRTALDELGAVVDQASVPQADNNFAVLMARAGKLEVAEKYARRAVGKAPRAPVYRYQLGHLLIDTGDLCAGLVQLAEALRLRPGYPEVRGLARRTLEANPTLSCAGSAGAP
ncbi:MAG: hypothetical protein ACAI38_09020 [Myxococcota bacterium]|nr:hypothetical protein [Myxococcota bacterium]